ncbi:hypothetical protein [Microbacterium oleivorans]|uniref:Uncharacterized protein n=1 Tax=Microbacterium oleivorans TaxID=273677 RepID=A0A7D5IWC7_9MICO|nr:hypothetical protein [Microbacterium oleivorans]QLD10976.1 hypothetical protein HW566_03735 [Microbacterium oleivorans]
MPRIERIAWGAAALLAVTGVVITVIQLVRATQPASFGWFAYQPISNAVFTPAVTFVSPQMWGGIVTLVVGLIALAFLAGRRSVTRRAIVVLDDSEG